MSRNTTIAYRTDLRQFFTWLSENDMLVTAPAQITRTHIIDYLVHLAQQGRSGVTRARKLAAIREYCRFLLEEKLLVTSPATTIGMPKKERKSRVFLRVDEYMRLLNAAAGNSRDYAILQLFLQTGIRVEELTKLLLSDIDQDGGTMLINGKGNKQRTITLRRRQPRPYEHTLHTDQKPRSPCILELSREWLIRARGDGYCGEISPGRRHHQEIQLPFLTPYVRDT